MQPSRMILMVVSGGIIVLSWLNTLAIPLISIFIIGNQASWYVRFLVNVTPAASATSTFLIISATSILAACNRWFSIHPSSNIQTTSRNSVSVL